MKPPPNARALEWLHGELPGLVAEGLLTPEGAETIRARYALPERRTAASVAIIGFSALAALFIVSGIILILAVNWEMLTRGMRAAIAFVPLLTGQGLVAYTLLKRPDSTAWREGSAFFLTGAIGASIALIGQTYHLPGSYDGFIGVWMLLAWPLIYLLNASLLALLLMAAALSWGAETMLPGKGMYVWLFVGGLLPHLALACRANPRGLRFQVLSWGFAGFLLALPATFDLYVLTSHWVIGYALLFGLMLLFGLTPAAGPWGNPYRLIGGASLAVLCVLLTFGFAWEGDANYEYVLDGELKRRLSLLPAFSILTIVPSLGLLAYHGIRLQRLPLLWGGIPFFVLAGRYFISTGTSPDVFIMLANAYVLVLALGTIREGVAQGAVGLTNVGMALLAAFFTMRFFDLDLPFFIRGVLFILIGIGFLCGNIYLARRMRGNGKAAA